MKATIEINESATCLRCEYPLRGLSEPVCPECGFHFDPTDPRTYEVERRGIFGRHWHAAPPLWHLLAVAVVLPAVYLASTPGESRSLAQSGYAIAAFGKWLLLLASIDYLSRLISAISLRIRMRDLTPYKRTSRWRWLVLPAALALWFSIRLDPWPLRARFYFSQDDFERTAAGLMAGSKPSAGPHWLGLYPIGRVEEVLDGASPSYYFVTGGMSGHAGFVYRPYCCAGGRHWLVFDDDARIDVGRICDRSETGGREASVVRPVSGLGGFEGEDAFGDWKLTVADSQPGVSGNLLDWTFTPNRRVQSPHLAVANLGDWGAVDRMTYDVDGSIAKLYVELTITHGKLKNLIGRLRHLESGRQVTLFDFRHLLGRRLMDIEGASEVPEVGGTIRIALDDRASYPVEFLVLPVMGLPSQMTFRPTEPLGRFNGEPLRGTWELTVVDREEEHQVQINEWSIYPIVVTEPVGAPIPDGGPVAISSVLRCETHATISTLEIGMHILHANLSHLTITLEHADTGTKVELLRDANSGVKRRDELARYWYVRR
jgi:subtilisin-like proprotein convertase family protein